MPQSPQPTDPTTQQLAERVARLEARLAELEAAAERAREAVELVVSKQRTLTRMIRTWETQGRD